MHLKFAKHNDLGTWNILQVCVLALLVSHAQFSFSKEHTPIAQIAMAKNFNAPPYQWTNECSGEPTGIFIEMVKHLMNKAGVKFEFIPIEFNEQFNKSVISAMQDGKVNMFLMSGLEDHDLLTYMSSPLLLPQSVLLSRQPLRDDTVRWENLKYKKLGVVTIIDIKLTNMSETFLLFAKRNNISLKPILTIASCLEAINDKEIDYCVHEVHATSHLINQNEQELNISIPQRTMHRGIYLGALKDSSIAAMLPTLDKHLKALLRSGSVEIIYEYLMQKLLHKEKCTNTP